VSTVVGVRVQANSKDGFGDDAFVFPVRLGSASAFLSPENLPMHMLPQLRRVLILLSSIKPDETVLYCPKDGSNTHVTIVHVDELTNSIVFQQSDGKLNRWTIALDRIVTVFRAAGDAPPYWRIMMHNG
jgi:hypothetical protein